jgi:hypothetical protein
MTSPDENSDDKYYDYNANHGCHDIVDVVAGQLADGVDVVVVGAYVDYTVDYNGR